MNRAVTDAVQQEVGWKPWPGGQEAFLACPVREIFAHGNRGGGKRLASDQPVLTDRGWVPAGDVTMRDRLVAPDGTYTNILGIYPGKREQYYRVTTEGGASVVACAEHRWLTYAEKNGNRQGWRVRTTEELLRLKERFYLPLMSAPAPGKKWRKEFDPYIAGYILGDGTTNAANTVVYTVDQYTVDYLQAAGWKAYSYDSQNTTMVICPKQEGYRWQEFLGKHSGEDKRIPQELLDADPDARLALLQGLMDSDGSVEAGRGTPSSPGGQCSFVNISEHLAKGVQYLVRSLGGKARIGWKDKHSGKGGTTHGYWHVSITHANKFNPFRMPRKARLVRKQKGTKDRIKTIEPVGLRDGVCFAVAHESHLFVTKDFMVTHNTEILLVKYLSYVGQFGAAWRGIIFRREYKHLDDLIAKSKRLFRLLGVKARWMSSKSDYKWVFDTGEELLFRSMKDPEDYWNYHGHEYPFIGWEELTNYPDDDCYTRMRSCNRCPIPKVPKFYLSTGNPYGAGHGWVKQRFIDPAPDRTIILDEKNNQRVAIRVSLEDNLSMVENDPEYIDMLDSIENDALREAWRDGSWDIVVGGFLQGIWDYDVHTVDDFEIPIHWRRWRAHDWGFAKPSSTGWYAVDPDTGIVYRYRELYTWTGKRNQGTRASPDEVAKQIHAMEAAELAAGAEFRHNPADTNLWASTSIKQAGREITPAQLMREQGVNWVPARKGPGSRVAGAQIVISMLRRRKFKVFRQACPQFLATVPVLMPDPDNWDDVDTTMEDHIFDELRYSLTAHHRREVDVEKKETGPKPGTFDWLLQYGNEEKKRSIYRST